MATTPPPAPRLRQYELAFLLRHVDPRRNKRALQLLCDAIEAGAPIELARDLDIAYLIANLKSSTDPLVRRWLYKFIGLTRWTALAVWMRWQIVAHETEPENLTWAYGAYSSLTGLVSARRILDSAGHDDRLPRFTIASDYFRHRSPVDGRTLARATSDDDSLAHQWLAMRHGQVPSAVDLPVIRDLTTSTDPVVVEYALWSAHRDTAASLSDVTIDPGALAAYAPNIRRWYIRLLLKSPDNIVPYLDIIEAAISDPNSLVREAVALGIPPLRLPGRLISEIANWYVKEDDPLVYHALRRLVARSARIPALRALAHQAQEEEAAEFHSPTARLTSARIIVPTRRRVSMQPTLDPIPRITSETEEHVYILGVDTVSFSKKTDRMQYAIFRDLLDALQHNDLIRSQLATDMSVLLTGDGFFVCFRAVTNRTTPLRLGLTLLHDFHELRRYELRFGANAGPATWVTMQNGTTQVISHAINWTARVLSAADSAGVYLSDSYYETIIHPARDDFAGVAFSDVIHRQTKHEEPLPVRSASYTILSASS